MCYRRPVGGIEEVDPVLGEPYPEPVSLLDPQVPLYRDGRVDAAEIHEQLIDVAHRFDDFDGTGVRVRARLVNEGGVLRTDTERDHFLFTDPRSLLVRRHELDRVADESISLAFEFEEVHRGLADEARDEGVRRLVVYCLS